MQSFEGLIRCNACGALMMGVLALASCGIYLRSFLYSMAAKIRAAIP